MTSYISELNDGGIFMNNDLLVAHFYQCDLLVAHIFQCDLLVAHFANEFTPVSKFKL